MEKEPKAKTEEEKQNEIAELLKQNEVFINQHKLCEEEIEKKY